MNPRYRRWKSNEKKSFTRVNRIIQRIEQYDNEINAVVVRTSMPLAAADHADQALQKEDLGRSADDHQRVLCAG